MKLTILKLGWIMLVRDRASLFLSFLLPIMFFTIFVVIFGSSSGGSTDPISCIVVDLDNTQASQRFIQALKDDPSLKILTEPKHGDDQPAEPYTRETAQEVVKAGDARVAAILPKGFGETVGSFSGDSPPVELLTDSITDPIAYQVVNGLMQRAVIAGAPDIMIQRGLDQFEQYAGELTPRQRELMDRWLLQLRDEVISEESNTTQPATTKVESSPSSGGADDSSKNAANKPSSGLSAGLVSTKVINVRTDHKTEWNALVAFQASATAVMFLLFAVSAGGGSLLEDQESGVLDRLLISNVGMTNLLLGKWLFIAIMGFLQVSVMFLWGSLLFGLELFTPGHLLGFIIMTTVTACAASSLGIVLAASCNSRTQLGGLSTIVVLTMSAIGGSMFPRFLMPATLQLVGKFCTFNAWALDGYRKVFYYNLPLIDLWPELLVLSSITVGLLILARVLARRWEAA